jgi:DNA-binding transcriptional regulator YdaS (Cro superfamily)
LIFIFEGYILRDMKKATVVEHFGGIESEVARVLGISPQAVNDWPDVIPKGRAYQLQVITAGKLTVDPSLYPRPKRRARG